ncbi:hypothetical protein [Aquibacillus kalidii]|nr:hypothetical protein [Aquibacillus kalidii]
MNHFSCFVDSVEKELSRKLSEKEREFLAWLYQQHKEEKKLKAN